MYVVPHSYPNLTEEDKLAVLSCFELEYVGEDEDLKNMIINKIRFYLNYTHIETIPSASIGLLIVLKFLELDKKSEVILSGINCWSVYNLINLENYKPIVCDVRSKKDFRTSYSNIVKKITEKTKVIIITHMYGCFIEEKILIKLKEKYPEIYIIEDFSTSLSSKKNLLLANYSDFAIASFGSTKLLTGGIGGVLASKNKIINSNYDRLNISETKLISINTKISRLNQTLLYSQLNYYENYQKIKKCIIKFYNNFCNIYDENSDDLFRAITFENPRKLISYLKEYDIQLDIRNSVQPNLIKELKLKSNSNAYKFKKYYSLPLNINAYNVFKKKGLL